MIVSIREDEIFPMPVADNVEVDYEIEIDMDLWTRYVKAMDIYMELRDEVLDVCHP